MASFLITIPIATVTCARAWEAQASTASGVVRHSSGVAQLPLVQSCAAQSRVAADIMVGALMLRTAACPGRLHRASHVQTHHRAGQHTQMLLCSRGVDLLELRAEHR